MSNGKRKIGQFSGTFFHRRPVPEEAIPPRRGVYPVTEPTTPFELPAPVPVEEITLRDLYGMLITEITRLKNDIRQLNRAIQETRRNRMEILDLSDLSLARTNYKLNVDGKALRVLSVGSGTWSLTVVTGQDDEKQFEVTLTNDDVAFGDRFEVDFFNLKFTNEAQAAPTTGPKFIREWMVLK